MDNTEIENTINKLSEAIELIGSVNIYNPGNNQQKTFMQRKLNKGFDILFDLKRHLEFIKKRSKDV